MRGSGRERIARAALAAAIAGLPAGAAAEPPDIAYDQAQRIFFGQAAPAPQPFDAFLASFAAPADPGTTYPPVGGIALPTDAPTLARLRAGLTYRVSYLGTSVRIDDPAAQRATIGRRDPARVLYLDLAHRTYRTVTGDAATALLANDLFASIRAIASAAPVTTGSGDSEVLALDRSFATLDPVEIDGLATHGSRVETTTKPVSHTGACPELTSTATIVSYVDPARDERTQTAPIPTDPNDILKSLPQSRCRFRFAGEPPPVPASPDRGRFAIFTSASISFSIPQLAAPVVTSQVVERGHFRTLGPEDAARFELPPGFREVP